MIEKSNIRFSYEQKNQFLEKDEVPPMQKQGIGRLLSKFERSQPFDDQQEQLISKKNALINIDSIKKSQIYSEIQLNKSQKISPRLSSKKQESKEKYSFNEEVANQVIKQKKDNGNDSTVLQAPKSLPQIVRNSKELRNSMTPKLFLNESFNESSIINQSKRISKGKSFSINHYDIYKPGFIVSRQELEASRKKEGISSEKEQKQVQKNSSFVPSQSNQQLQEEIPQQPIKISFENETDKQFPQSKDVLQFSASNSKAFVKAEELEMSVPNPVPKNIEQQQIKIGNSKLLIKSRRESVSTKNERLFQSKRSKNVSELTNQKQQLPAKQVEVNESKGNEKEEEFALKSVKSREKQKLKINDSTVIKLLDSEDEGQKKNERQRKKMSARQQKQQKQQKMKEQKQQEGMKIQRKQSRIDKENQHQGGQSKNQIQLKQQSYRPYQYQKFKTEDYMQVYQILKKIQGALKTPIIDSHSLLKAIKNYLQVIAAGSLDHIDGYSMPLHRLKTIKNALLYERIGVVVVSFAYSVGKMKECLKYLINLITYASNNCLLIIKILESSQIQRQDQKNPVLAKSDRLILKRNYDTIRNSNDIILDAIFKISKAQEAFYESFKDIIKSVGKNSLEQTFYNVLQYFSFFLCIAGLHLTIPFLAVAPNPYLRQTLDNKPTLVIDIVEVFCHGTRKSKSSIFRPHTQYFLHEMSQYYQIVSFTCAYPNQIDKIIDILDPKRHIKHRLYRHHALTRHNILFKDPERLGRDLRKVIILDSENNYISGESLNTIAIPIWRGGKNDTTLAQLCPILATIVVKDMDCQQAIKKINQQHLKNEEAGIKYLNFGINLE